MSSLHQRTPHSTPTTLLTADSNNEKKQKIQLNRRSSTIVISFFFLFVFILRGWFFFPKFTDYAISSTPQSTLIVNNDASPHIAATKIAFAGSFLIDAGLVWVGLLTQGKQWIMMNQNRDGDSNNPKLFAAMEIGMHRAIECIKAAQNNFEAYCLEPSPKSFVHCENKVSITDKTVQDRIHLLNIAAGNFSGTVEFSSSGSTGDMVGGGGNDMWTMTKTKTKSSDANNNNNNNNGNIVQIQSAKLDDIISEHIPSTTEIYIAKIDVQGFEPYVFAGLQKSIQQHRIQFFLFEYWPKGMDFMLDVDFDGEEICQASVQILENLVANGYALFQLEDVVHPHSYSHSSPKMKQEDIPEAFQERGQHYLRQQTIHHRPLDDIMDNCLYFYQLEREIFPQEDYYMGFWSDILAVAPTVTKQQFPSILSTTETGLSRKSHRLIQDFLRKLTKYLE